MYIVYREMKAEDYSGAFELWNETESLRRTEADSFEAISKFLQRNPNLSFVAEENGRVIGTVLCSSDGRRGYIYHLAVHREHRRKGIAEELIKKASDALKKDGIEKCHLFVFTDNNNACAFYDSIGWDKRKDIFVYSKNI